MMTDDEVDYAGERAAYVLRKLDVSPTIEEVCEGAVKLAAEVRRLKEECAQVSISYDIDVADLPLVAMMENLAVPMTRVRIVAKRSDGWYGCEPDTLVRMVHADTEAEVLHMLDSASVTRP